MADQGLAGKLVVSGRWAQYALGVMGARKPGDSGVEVAFDGRFRTCYPQESRLEVDSLQGLLAEYARSKGADAIVRGLRAPSDFEYELQMAQMNRYLLNQIETIFLAPDQQFSFLSSTLVREVAALGGDVSGFVSPFILTKISEKS